MRINMWHDNNPMYNLVVVHEKHPEDNKPSSLQWRQNERDCVSNHQCLDCLLNYLFRRRSKKTSKMRVTGLCEEESTGDRWIPLTKGQ